MNWDKQSVIAVVVGAAVLIWWYAFGAKMFEQPVPPAPAPAAAVEQSKPQQSAAAVVPAAEQKAAPVKTMQMVTLSGSESSYTIQPVSGAIRNISFDKKIQKNAKGEILEHANENNQNNWLGTFGVSSPSGALQTVKVLQSKKLNDKEYLLTRLMRDSAGTEFTVTMTFKALDNYQMQMNMLVSNPGKKAIPVPVLNISAGELPQWFKLSGDPKSNSQELHTIEYCTLKGKVKNEEAAADADDWQELNSKTVRWFGVVNRFYAQLLSCSEPVKLFADRKMLAKNEYVVNTGALLDAFTLAPGSSKEFKFNSYFGPKEPTALRKFDSEATEVMHLGWFPIDFLAYIMLAIMNWLYDTTP